ncbi:MAG: 4Fe-4S binding protein [Desulfuromonadales bacterium]|nr:4Fe-4S binding protein [Desulfuromonadales bacterium]
MAVNEKPGKPIFATEAAWCDGSKERLCLPSGTWRTERPVVEVAKCTYCGLCYLFCPPQCIHPGADHFPIDLEFCKGCGICAKECPTKAITMVAEGVEDDDASSEKRD